MAKFVVACCAKRLVRGHMLSHISLQTIGLNSKTSGIILQLKQF